MSENRIRVNRIRRLVFAGRDVLGEPGPIVFIGLGQPTDVVHHCLAAIALESGDVASPLLNRGMTRLQT